MVYPAIDISAVVTDCIVTFHDGRPQLIGEGHGVQVLTYPLNLVYCARETEAARGIHALEKELTLQRGKKNGIV